MVHVRASDPASELEQAASDFVALRPRLFSLAYRIVGSASEAEDIVQEVWLRWQVTDRSIVGHPPAFLAKTSTHLAINVAQSARSRRETQVSPWLPEPVDTGAGPEVGAERGEALALAILLLLEKLSPTERAVFVLREAFEYSYQRIAATLQISEANTRQLVSRARKHLVGQHRGTPSPTEGWRLLEAFVAASQQGDLVPLERLLAADVARYSASSGARRAA